MVRVRYLWLSGWHCRPDFFYSRRFHQQPHSGFRSFCHRLSCKTAREHFFGFAGDWAGRGRALKISLIMMAAPTVLIGFLPTYNTVGVLAPVLLLVLRLVQGFAMGGELPLNGC